MSKLREMQGWISGRPMCIDMLYFQSILEAEVDSDMVKFARMPLDGFERNESVPVYSKRGSMALIEISGMITESPHFLQKYFGGTDYQTISKAAELAMNDDDVKTVTLLVNSPGGETDGITEAEYYIREMVAKKPTVTFNKGMNCSAAYWLSSAAEHVFVSPTSITGSIGVAAYTRKGDSQSTTTYLSKNAKNKDKPEKWLQGVLDETEGLFRASVSKNRGVSLKFIDSNWGDGSVFSATESVTNRMADSIMSLRELL